MQHAHALILLISQHRRRPPWHSCRRLIDAPASVYTAPQVGPKLYPPADDLAIRMAMFATPRDLPDELLPYSGKLSDRFYEVRQNVAEFCQEIKVRLM